MNYSTELLNILLRPTPGPVHTQGGCGAGCEQWLVVIVVVVVEVVSIVVVVAPDHVEDGHHVPRAEADVVLRAAARADEGVVCQEVGGRPRPPSGGSPGHQAGLHWSGCGPHLERVVISKSLASLKQQVGIWKQIFNLMTTDNKIHQNLDIHII